MILRYTKPETQRCITKVKQHFSVETSFIMVLYDFQ